jgi:hypothetical protein
MTNAPSATTRKNQMSRSNPLTNYNIFALQGDTSVDDMDVVETMGLEPKVAYTPDINRAAIEKMRMENIDHYMKTGMDVSKAKELANVHAEAAYAAVKAAMEDQKKQFDM